MANHSHDWRDTEQRLRDLPDHELREALADAGVKAVLPSDRKARSTVRPPGGPGESTTRWANGDWQERISLAELPDAQKFLENPDKPPTLALPKGTALSSPSPARRPWSAMVLGLVGTACALGLVVYAVRDSAFLDRPRVAGSQPPATEAADAAAEAVAAAAAAVREPAAQGPASGAKSGLSTKTALAAQPTDPARDELVGPARPAGSRAADESEVRERDDARLRFLRTQAQQGDVNAMIAVARMLVERGDANAAMKWAGRAKLKRRNSIAARIVLGDAQMLAGYGKAAEATWRGALARSPRNQELKQRLGE